MNRNRWIRQVHRWLSVVLTVAMIINVIAIAEKKYTNSLGLMAVAPFALLFLSGVYLFVLPYAAKWRSERLEHPNSSQS
jgi:FtsH-binding integral membrane protein